MTMREFEEFLTYPDFNGGNVECLDAGHEYIAEVRCARVTNGELNIGIISPHLLVSGKPAPIPTRTFTWVKSLRDRFEPKITRLNKWSVKVETNDNILPVTLHLKTRPDHVRLEEAE